MGTLRLYKKFYVVSNDVYTPITPVSVSAECYVAGSGETNSTILIESGLPITEEEVGIFYADLDATKYSSDVTYDLVWSVQYTTEAPADKRLITRFRIKPYNVANNLEYSIDSSSVIEYQILGTY